MKKLLIMLVISALLLVSAFAAENTVYVNDGGSGDGSSAQTPVGTLDAAYAALGNEGGTIVINDKLTVASKFTEPAHTGEITITGGTLSVGNIRFVLNGATTFENITLSGEDYLSFIAQFNPIVLGEGITVKGFGKFTSVSTAISIVGGVLSGEGKYSDNSLLNKDTHITVKSGKAIIIGFNRNLDKACTGTAHINLEGGTYYNIYMGSASAGTGGNVKMNISGGTFIYNVYSNAKTSKLTGNIEMRISGGDFSATTLERFDGSVTTADATSVADVRGLENYSTLLEKMEGFTMIITDEGEILPNEKLAIQDAFLYGSFTASDGTVLPYRYYLPEGYETSGKDYPIFLYMHGNGSRGTNNTSQLNSYCINTAVYNSDYECIMIAPQCPSSPYEWTLYGTVGKVNIYPGSEEYAKFLESGEPYGSKYFCAAAELLDTFLTDYRVDTSKVYLGGSSNGTGAVWNFMALYPEVFAAAIPVSGSRATDDFAHSIAHRMKDISIWAFHGDLDTSSSGSPVEGTRALAAAIKEVGGKITYTEVVGGNHSNIWKIAADTPGIVDWLFAQSNDSFENTISKEKGAPLSAPKNLKWNNTTATWDVVENAGAYKVTFYVDGAAKKTVFTCHNYFDPAFQSLSDGEYTFSVRAYPQKNAYSIGEVSAESEIYSFDIGVVADYNGDGVVNVADVTSLVKAIINKKEVVNGDLNGDKKITLVDAIRLIKYIMEN